jgi:PAS domain-containing protein
MAPGLQHKLTHLASAGNSAVQEDVMPDAIPFEQIEAIYRSAPIGLGVLDRELRYVRVNDLLARINGLPPAAHLGRRVSELLPEIR